MESYRNLTLGNMATLINCLLELARRRLVDLVGELGRHDRALMVNPPVEGQAYRFGLCERLRAGPGCKKGN